jgi:HD-GYP domain-containing protein (c-di-GMP phosphodiesterase class II)
MSTIISIADRDAPAVTARLRAEGIFVTECDASGELHAGQVAAGDWLARALLESRLLHQAIRDAVEQWSMQGNPQASKLFPGCWVVPLPIEKRRRRTGYTLILIPTMALLESEQFAAMCQSAQLDYQVCAAQLRSLGPASDSEVTRIARLASYCFMEHERLATANHTMESVGQQLAESYEEITLLYTISQSMRVIQQPRKFVHSACEGLLDTLAYRWVGAQFIEQIASVRSLAGRLVTAGEPTAPPETMHALVERILELVQPEAPLVLDPAQKPDHAIFAPLGQPIVVHPISREGRVLGVFMAADKMGADRAASSADLKLLGATASHAGIFLENAALYEDMDAMFLGTLEALTASIDAKDRYTCGHSQRVAHLSQRLAVAIGLDEESVRRIHVAGLVHDVGKIGVPEAVLCKAGRLTDAEFDLVKQHPEIGYRILKDIPQLRDVLPGVLHHHERWDGRGYPAGLAGQEIPLSARVIALADSFDAMSSNRTYRTARERAWVLSEIRASAGSQFDPELAASFVQIDFTQFDRLLAEQRDQRPAVILPARGEAA